MKIEQLAERHFLEYEARLKHMDELFGRAEKGIVKASNHLEISKQLNELREERTRLKKMLSDYKKSDEEYAQVNDLEHQGPMIMWQEVAERLEKLVERIEH